MRNGMYWVWWPTENRTSNWFLLRMNNGHGQFVGAKIKCTAARMLQDDLHFARVPDRETARLKPKDTAEDIIEALAHTKPEHNPFFYTRFIKQPNTHESTSV